MLAEGLYAVPPGHVAAIVTHLEMRAAPPQRPVPSHPGTIRRIGAPEPDWYLDLFRRIGAPWLWSGRLGMKRRDLVAILHDPLVEIHALMVEDRAKGLAELDFRDGASCELAYFGLTPGLSGRGAGRALMDTACRRAWSRPIERFHVHTCTLDDPAALGFYERSGFRAVRREVDIAPDPRALGLLPDDAAAQVAAL